MPETGDQVLVVAAAELEPAEWGQDQVSARADSAAELVMAPEALRQPDAAY